MGIVVTDDGQEDIIDLITAGSYHIGWGSSTTAASVLDADLNAALPESRVGATDSQPNATTARFVGTITASADRTVGEMGVFVGAGTGNPPTGGRLWIHYVHQEISVANTQSITYTIDMIAKDVSE